MNSDTLYISAGLDIATPDDYTYHVIDKNVSDSSSLIFKVAACHNAHVLLMKEKDSETSNTYEINIGKLVRYALCKHFETAITLHCQTLQTDLSGHSF